MLRITKVEEKDVPKKVYRNKLKAELQGFMAMNIKVAKVDTGDHYASTEVAARTIRLAANRHGFPIDVVQRKDEVFFIRRDM